MSVPKAQLVVDHPFRLDNGLVIEVRLPERLSQAEGARLISYITSLVQGVTIAEDEAKD